MKSVLLAMFLLAGVYAAEPDSFAELRKSFARPGPWYSTAPFFVWNGEVTEHDIDKMLAEYKAQGIDAFFIHPRPGLITPYLSERWFELVRYTVDRAKKLGMIVWLYDENSYPSGFAGGHVPAEMPESYNQGQGLVPRKIEGTTAGPECIVVNGDTCFVLAHYEKRAWHGGHSYVDLLKPGVTEKFIEITMRGYEKSIGLEFAGTVPGIFTDEPNIIAPNRNAMRWTPDLFEQFQKRWGYDLWSNLTSLFENTGDWQRVRHNYYGLLLELFIERWSKPWFAYAEKSKLQWTGHYWEHGWPSPVHGPDNMAMYAWHHVPGIDMLFNQFEEGVNAQFGNVRAVKELSSVANQMGRRRTLSETYGGAGWELRFEDMKRLGDWQAVLGVNLMNQHLSHQTLVGARKYDYPQSFTYHTPWWPHYKALAGYFARLSLALSTGEQVNRILVLEPTTSAWMYAAIPKADARMMQIGEAFQKFLVSLEAMQVEYDLGSENILKSHGRVAGTELSVGKRSYEIVVLPPGTENLDAGTMKLLAGYTRAGGRVFVYDSAPSRVDGSISPELQALASKWTVIREEIGLANRNFEGVNGKLFHQRRTMKDGQLLFFVNSSLEEPASATMLAPGRTAIELDAMTGAVRPFPIQNARLNVELAPAGSLLLVVTNEEAGNTGIAVVPQRQVAVAAAGPLAVKRLSPNALRIDYCDLTLGGKTQRDIYFYKAQEAVFAGFGLKTNPWNTAVQYKTSILDQNRFPPGSSFEAVFHFDVVPGVSRRALNAVIERPELWAVSVNGKPVVAEKGASWLDERFGVYPIGALVHDGANAITLRAEQMSVHHELEPVFVTGDFGLEAQARGWRMAPDTDAGLGPWKAQNLPQYFDRVAYATDYNLEKGSHSVQLGKWSGTLAEVLVNGKQAGLIFSKPYKLDITPYVATGKNRIEVVVYGSLKNLLGPHHGKINRGLVSPWAFRSAPEHMPPGASYDLDEYGLMENFTVMRGSAR